jgi:hypothetical protein
MFLHPDLPAILEIGWNRGVSMTANNGVHFNRVSDDVLTALVKYDFASMTVSIDGASDSTYRVYRIGGNFDQVVNNIKRLNDLKRQYQKPCPMLHWQFIAFGHNEHEIGQARKLARELDMTFSVKLAWGDHSPVKNTDLVSRETGLGVASREAFRAERGADYLDNICLQLWHSPQINWDGKMLGCSRNFWGDFGANAFVDGYLPSVNSDRMIHARRMLLGRAPPREDIPCTTCDIYIDRAKSMRWVTPRSSSFKAECNRR